ncbi:MAG: hypothetical protein KJ890_01810 [Gammaproteobacteria bacterium]|nr:hypothetical protein [Gammaproteobacteria bacterium]MBU1805015.1 hypothetical protein [Gammaproteobacteria bacterium]
MARVTKKIHYFRAVGYNDQASSIQRPIQDSLDTFPTIADTEINFVDHVIRVQRKSPEANYLLLHLTKYIPGNRNSVITPRAATAVDEEQGHSAPDGKEFKSGECFILIAGYHVLFCSNSLSHQKAELYLHKLLQEANADFDPFKFKPASNLNKLNLIRSQGVKSIRLNVNAFHLSLPERQRNWFNEASSKVASEITALVGRDRTRSEERALEDLIVSVEIGLDGNSKATEDAQKTVIDLATEVLADDDLGFDGFVIRTRDDTPVTSNDVRLSLNFRVSLVDTTLNHGETWDAMRRYYASLDADHLLER